MKNIIRKGVLILSVIILANCNNSGTAEKKDDPANKKTDTIKMPVVTEGGLRDSIPTGATDSTTKKERQNK
jgi:hypothetical protein